MAYNLPNSVALYSARVHVLLLAPVVESVRVTDAIAVSGAPWGTCSKIAKIRSCSGLAMPTVPVSGASQLSLRL